MERPVELQERIFRKPFEAALIAAFTREELDEYFLLTRFYNIPLNQEAAEIYWLAYNFNPLVSR